MGQAGNWRMYLFKQTDDESKDKLTFKFAYDDEESGGQRVLQYLLRPYDDRESGWLVEVTPPSDVNIAEVERLEKSGPDQPAQTQVQNDDSHPAVRSVK